MVVQVNGISIDTDSEFFMHATHYMSNLHEYVDSDMHDAEVISPQLATEQIIGIIEMQPGPDRVRMAMVAEYVCACQRKAVEERRRAHLAGVNIEENASDIFIDTTVVVYNTLEDELSRCLATWKSYINQYR